MWILLSNIDLRCFVARQFLSQIYALLSVKFSGLKMCECKKNDKYQVCSLNNFSDTVRGWRLMFQRWGKASIVFLKGKPSLQKKCFANGHCPFEGVAGGRPLYVWFGPLLHQFIVLNKLAKLRRHAGWVHFAKIHFG